jgi:uncharacterized membrane protein
MGRLLVHITSGPEARTRAALGLFVARAAIDEGRHDMTTIEKSINVEVPVSTAYDQWTQFESFPQHMEGVEARGTDTGAWRGEVKPGGEVNHPGS